MNSIIYDFYQLEGVEYLGSLAITSCFCGEYTVQSVEYTLHMIFFVVV